MRAMRDNGDDRSIVQLRHRAGLSAMRRANGDPLERARPSVQGVGMGEKGSRPEGWQVMGKMKDIAIDDVNAIKSRRGRRARARGNSFELESPVVWVVARVARGGWEPRWTWKPLDG